MTIIDLRRYVVGPTGTWFNDSNNFQSDLLRLIDAADGLTLVGPLRVRICVQALNRFTLLATAAQALSAKDVMSYVLDLPPGQAWTYPAAFELGTGATLSTGTQTPQGTLGLLRDTPPGGGTDNGGGLVINTNTGGDTPSSGGTGGLSINTNIGAYSLAINSALSRRLLGSNAGAAILIRPAGPDACDACGASTCDCAPNPCKTADPCAPKSGGCQCGCSPCNCGGGTDDIPCDFAVRGRPDAATFFPSSCEPCAPGARVAMPATKGPALLVKPASGGTIRTRFYNGMHIGKEDFETDQKNVRIKRALMNRAIGQGVAWGFGVSLDGNGLCVLPGYGLDCCGNDIVLSTAYRVDAAALAADPAAAPLTAMRGRQRLSLVLEYFECPQDPRPVHGDPCANDGGSCEPSRIRETARLRLAPPCEVDDSGPIKTFLAEIEKLRNDPAVGPLFTDGPCPPPFSRTSAPGLAAVPATVKIEMIGRPVGAMAAPDGATFGMPSNLLAVPSTGGDAQGDAFQPGPGEITVYSARITVVANPGYRFTKQGQVQQVDIASGQPTGTLIPLYANLTSQPQVVWEIPLPANPITLQAAGQDPIPPQFIERFSGWELTDGANNHFTGSFDPHWAWIRFLGTKASPFGWDSSKWGTLVAQGGVPNEKVPAGISMDSVLHLDVPPGTVSGVGAETTAPFPCFGGACDCANADFWNTFPFLHANPQNPCQAADWRVLVLAVLYVSLSGEMARSAYGTNQYVQSAALDAASAAYTAAWKLYFGTMPDTDRFSLTDSLQKLLQAWCKSLLYPGPTCRCSPHGVVVGCATVEGGTITGVDPWGGRRWVVQYPLLTYWGQQFGVMPLDAVASRLFDMICCFSALPGPKFPVAGKAVTDMANRLMLMAPGIRPTERVTGRDSMVQFGPATLVVGDAATIPQRVAMLGVARSQTLSPLEFVTHVTSMIGAAGTAPAGVPLVDYAVSGFPDMHLVAPDVSAASANAVAPIAVAPSVGAGGGGTSGGDVALFGRFVATEVAGRTGKGAAPALLRPLVASLSYNIAAALPIEAPANVKQALANKGIDTVGKLLDRDPEVTLATALGAAHAEAFSDVLEHAEKSARSVVKIVGDSVAQAAGDKQLVSRVDLKKAPLATALTKHLADRLKAAKIEAPPAVVASAVSEAAET